MGKRTQPNDSPVTELEVRVTPRAGRNELLLAGDGSVSARVCAPPADGQANAAVIQLVADRLGIAKSRLSIASGAASRKKRVRTRCWK